MDAAVAMGIHVNTLQNWEKGRSAPSAEIADLIAGVLQQPLNVVAFEIVKLAIQIKHRRAA